MVIEELSYLFHGVDLGLLLHVLGSVHLSRLGASILLGFGPVPYCLPLLRHVSISENYLEENYLSNSA